jgi:hypothetical protein
MGAGSGVGWHPRRNLEFKKKAVVAQRVALSSLGHLAPEIGYQWSDTLSFSVQGRFQKIFGEGSGSVEKTSPAKGAVAVVLKATRYWSFENLQLFTSANIGGGDGFRLVVPPPPPPPLNSTPDPTLPVLTDTVDGGPVIFGPGAGLMYNFTKQFAALLEVKALLGLHHFAAVLDVAASAQVIF